MDPRPLKFVAAACGGEIASSFEETFAKGVSIDSRKVQPGDVFFALAGEHADGHDFIADAAEKGAVAVVAERKRAKGCPPNCALIAVKDSRAALGRLGGAYRKDFAVPIVAVGGSNGKTTAKELIASVLRQKLETVWSEASFNNDIGVPLTLLRIEKRHQAAVMEAGTNHPGELAPLVRMIAPKHGVITSIGREHLEFFGDLAGVAKEEGSLAELLPEDGKLFLNGDDVWAGRIADRTRATVVLAGFSEKCEWRALSVAPEKSGVLFQVQAPQPKFSGEYRINLLGRHQVVNALLAIAIGYEFGLDRLEIERGLAECKPPKMRMELWEHKGVRVLDDAYNANTDSMLAALQTLQELPCKGRRVAVLGDMAEQGAHSEAAHEEVGRRAAELGIGQLFAVGKMAPVLARGARNAGLSRVMEFADVPTAAAAIKSFIRQGDLVLLKASRATALERVSEHLRSGEPRTECCIT